MRSPAQFQLPRRVKVVSDAGNGTAGPVFRRILEKLNCETIELFFEMDGRFPNHHPDPTQPENLQQLVAAVLGDQADVGLAFDGDSDRIGAVDEKGNDSLWRSADDHLRARDSVAQAGRDDHRRSEVVAEYVRRYPASRRQRRSCGRPGIR